MRPPAKAAPKSHFAFKRIITIRSDTDAIGNNAIAILVPSRNSHATANPSVGTASRTTPG